MDLHCFYSMDVSPVILTKYWFHFYVGYSYLLISGNIFWLAVFIVLASFFVVG